ncbi:LacI family DNA-binding transcriptional regulator [Sessilibacter corallicola]|uniref:LacI family DNA-binding transcriptional regulator n=1 Tax=Sessilibacter corallicola TaxID=2904075 RepID=A0ABQ0ACI2_9GAMM|nr:LacI family DNA-binding transcriptional regulator [Sessilibacter corallicola]MCE2029758.1 LacI family DNA-binding transcriptional regulator [Sessilibacter corallicola]
MDNESKKITINDVARLAEVSIKTVSRVINNEPNVRASTVKKVLAAVDSLNYQPSSFARSLAGTMTFNIALVYSNATPSYIYEVQSGALEACKKWGYELIIHPCDHTRPDLPTEFVSMYDTRKVDGILLTPPMCDSLELTQALENQGLQFARLQPGDPTASNSPFTGIDERAAARELVRHLIDFGHENIAIINGDPAHGAAFLRMQGYIDAMDEAGLPRPDEYVQQGMFDFESGRKCSETLLTLDKPPTAIFACNDAMAAGTMQYALKKGLKLPQDLSIVGFDDSPTAERLWPALTTVRLPAQELAKHCTDSLIAGIRKQKPEKLMGSCSYEIILRDSVAQNAQHV